MDNKADNYDVKKRTEKFAGEMVHRFASPPQTDDAQVCGKQILQSRTSIAPNYSEAYRARSTAESISKHGICLQKADGTHRWLEWLTERYNLTNDKINDLGNHCDEWIATMVSSINKLKRTEEA